MTLRVEVGKKGYVIIPKNIRDLIGIKEGDTMIIKVDNGRIILEPEKKIDISYIMNQLEQHKSKISYAKKAKLGDLAQSSLEEEFED